MIFVESQLNNLLKVKDCTRGKHGHKCEWNKKAKRGERCMKGRACSVFHCFPCDYDGPFLSSYNRPERKNRTSGPLENNGELDPKTNKPDKKVCVQRTDCLYTTLSY